MHNEIKANESEEEIEVVVLEEYAAEKRKPPLAREYRFKVNEILCQWNKPTILGKQILEQAHLTPPENYSLREKVHGEPPRLIKLDEVVDLRKPGVEKFRAIRREQSEGEEIIPRRAVSVTEQDTAFLTSYGKIWESIMDGSAWILIHGFSLPPGYTANEVLLAIRVESGYPLSPFDMMYVHPALQRIDSKAIPQAEVPQQLDGKTFQRWSRHRPWVPGEDSLETHIYFIEDCFRHELTR